MGEAMACFSASLRFGLLFVLLPFPLRIPHYPFELMSTVNVLQGSVHISIYIPLNVCKASGEI